MASVDSYYSLSRLQTTFTSGTQNIVQIYYYQLYHLIYFLFSWIQRAIDHYKS